MYVLMGAFNGFVPSSLALAATNTPVRRMGKALSTIQTGALLGNTFGPAVGGLLAVALPRYRMLFLMSGACILSAGFIALIFAQETRQPDRGRFQFHPMRDLTSLARIPGVPLLYGLNFLVSVSFWGSIPVVSVYTLNLLHAVPALEAGAEEFWMGAVAMALAVASTLALPLWGRVLDRLEASRVLALCMFTGTIGSIFTVLAITPLHLVLARLVFGLLAVGAMPTLVTMMRRLSPPGMEARALALGTAFGMLGMGCGPLLGGFIGPFLGLRTYFAVNTVLLLIGFLAWARFGPASVNRPQAG
jgi:MFS family permease